MHAVTVNDRPNNMELWKDHRNDWKMSTALFFRAFYSTKKKSQAAGDDIKQIEIVEKEWPKLTRIIKKKWINSIWLIYQLFLERKLKKRRFLLQQTGESATLIEIGLSQS